VRSSISSFSAVTATTLALICGAYFVVQAGVGYPVPGERTSQWLGNVARMRELLYADRHDPNKPTIWIVGGSSALFGTVSDMIAERTGYNVRNYALHGGLHMDLLFSQIRGKVRKGDIVVAPIEWEVLDETFGAREFDYANYLQNFSRSVNPPLWTLYKLYTGIPLRHWWGGLVAYIYRPRDAESYWESYSAESLRNTWEHRDPSKLEMYHHHALSAAGDFNIDHGPTVASPIPSFKVPVKIAPHGPAQIDRWHSYFESVGARFVLTSPLMIEAEDGYVYSRQAWENMEHIRKQMAVTSTPFECDPVNATYALRYRLDTEYHLNTEGARLRSSDLSDCLSDLIKGRDVRTAPIDPADAVARVGERLSTQAARATVKPGL
jgi:hypothetical protein